MQAYMNEYILCVHLWLPDTPSQRVQFLLGTEDDDEEHIPHDLFTQLDEISWREGEDVEWRETARYTVCATITVTVSGRGDCSPPHHFLLAVLPVRLRQGCAEACTALYCTVL